MLIRNTSIYMISSIIPALVSFIMIPIYTAQMSPAEYGVYAMISILSSSFLFLIHMNLFNILTRDYYDESINKLSYIYNMLSLFVVSFLLYFVLVTLFSGFLLRYLKMPMLEGWIYLVLCLSFVQAIIHLYLTILRLQNKAMQFFYISVVLAFFSAFFGYYWVVVKQLKWQGIFISQLISYSLVLCVIGLLCRRYLKPQSFNMARIKEFILFSIRMFPTTVSWRLIDLSSRFFITRMIGLAQLGLYSLGFQLTMPMTIIRDSFNRAWAPYFMKEMHNKCYRQILSYQSLFIAFITLVIVMVYFIAPFIVRLLFSEDYFFAIPFFNWFLLVVLFASLNSMVGNYLVFFKKELNISKATSIGMIINVALNYVFILDRGAIGSVQATVVAYMSIFAINLFYVYQLYRAGAFESEIKG